MRALITGVVTLLFIAGYTLYVLNTHYMYIENPVSRKMFINITVGLFTVILLLMGNSNRKNELEIELRRFAFGSFASYLIINVLHGIGYITNPFEIVYLFNGLNFVIVSLILYNASKYGFLHGR